MKYDKYNNEEYIQGIANGDVYFFKSIFFTLYDPLCNYCWRYVRSKAVSEDLVQEIFADLWNIRKTLNPKMSLKAYLYKAVKNKAFDYLKHQNVIKRLLCSSH